MLDELELIFLIDDIVFEVDRRARGLRGWLEEMYHDGEQLVRYRFSSSDLKDVEALVGMLEGIIDNTLSNDEKRAWMKGTDPIR